MKIGFLRIYHLDSLDLTVVQWCDASFTERPMFAGRYYFVDWMIQNHGWFRGWPVGIQLWKHRGDPLEYVRRAIERLGRDVPVKGGEK